MKKTVSVIAAGLLLASVGAVWGAEDGLVARYAFDEGGGTVAKDATGNGHDGAIKGATYVKSPRGFALSFDGVDDTADFGNKPTMNLAGDITLLIWVKTDAAENPKKHRVIFGDASKGVDRNLNLRINHANKLNFEWGNGLTNANFYCDADMLDGTWRHLALVCDSTAALLTLYVDGRAYAQGAMPLPISRTTFPSRFTGAWGYGAFKGEIDDIRLYNRALPEAEIEQVYASEAGAEAQAPAPAGSPADIVGRRRVEGERKEKFEAGPAYLAAVRPLDAAGTLHAVLCVPVANTTGKAQTVRIAVWRREAKTPEVRTLVVPDGAAAETVLDRVDMKPLFAKRAGLYVARSRPEVRRIVVSTPEARELRSRVLTPETMQWCEPIRIEVADRWRRDVAHAKTERIEMVVHTAFLDRQGELEVRLVSREDGRTAAEQRIRNPERTTQAVFDAKDLAWGAYDVRASWKDAGGREIAAAQALATVLPGGKEFIRPLNNLVTELMNARERGLISNKRSYREIAFMNPRDGWCFFAVGGDAKVRLDAETAPLAASPEAMRRLPAGRHVLRVEGQPTDLIVRAVPALIYNVHQATPQIAPFGTHTWERLQRTILPHCNVVEGQPQVYPEMTEWRAAGRMWVTHVQTPGLFDVSAAVTTEQACEAWRQSPGYSHPSFDGIQADEFIPSYTAESYLAFTESMGRLYDDAQFAGRVFIPFVVRPHRVENGALFMKAILAAGWPYSIELYLPEQPDEEKNREAIRDHLVQPAREYEDAAPGSLRKAIITPMYAALPYCTTNTCPSVDFKVHLEMQMHAIATDPLLFGVYGVQPYRSNYCDEETLRWMGRLLRHFAIEGRTDRPWKHPYALPHLKNPDFEEGMTGWEVRPAQKDSITAMRFAGYGALEGRYPPSDRGDTFALMKRSGRGGPNSLSQEVRALEAGRTYSLKMITADYQDLANGRTRRALHGVTMRIEGAETLPGAFQAPFRSYRTGTAKFTKESPLWMNYHWLQFRAKDATARLVITDEGEGPTGQEIAVNFVELQPVFAPGPAVGPAAGPEE